MSVIANFHKYYKDTDPALDLFDVIVSIYKWFYRNMWERRVQYMKTGKVISIATSDFPGQDFGFMPMEAVFYTRSCFRTMYSNKKSAAISSEGCVIQLPDSVSEELSLTNAYSILWTGCQTLCTIPIAVNNEWGDVLYATCPIMPAEDGSTFMLDKSRSVSSLYDFSKIIIVSTLSAERRVLYNAVAGVFNGKKYVDVLSTYLQSLYKCEALSCDVKMDSHYNIISSKIVSEVTSIGKITEDLSGFPINWYNDLFDLPANTIVRALQYVVVGGRLSVQGADILLRMQKCFGNALQSIYQTYEKCDWFLPLLLYSFSYYLPYFGEVKNLQQVLGVDKPTLKEMLSEPTSDIFIFWKVMNLHSPCSYVDFNFPSKVGDTELHSISDEAFKGCQYFHSVSIPREITEIGKDAFADCEGLEYIILEGRTNTDDMTLGENWNGSAQIVYELVEVEKTVDVPVDNDTADKDPSENVDTSKGSTDLPDSSSENTDSNDEDNSSEKNNSENSNTSTDEEVALPPEQEDPTAQQVG